jgi:hypothetical protein
MPMSLQSGACSEKTSINHSASYTTDSKSTAMKAIAENYRSLCHTAFVSWQ